MKTECPHCRHEYDLPETFKGQKVKCIKCGEVFVIKEPVKKTAPPPQPVPPRKKDAPAPKLIKCPTCGKSVASSAPYCPHCGVVVNKQEAKLQKGGFNRKDPVHIAGVVLAIIFVYILILLILAGR